MEAGRRVDVATNLLNAKDVPYMVAAPLLIQDLKGWRKDGVQGLQQVLYCCGVAHRCSCGWGMMVLRMMLADAAGGGGTI